MGVDQKPTPEEDVLPIFQQDADIVAQRKLRARARTALARTKSASGSPLFDLWRKRLHRKEVLQEFSGAMAALVSQYNPSHRANRHLVGGVVEHILAATLSVAGPKITVHGDDANGYDFSGTSKTGPSEMLSVKSSFGRSDYKISNGLGGAGKGMTHPTLFLGPTLPGLVIIHPNIHIDVVSDLRDTGDGWSLSRRAVSEHASRRPECVLGLEMPENPRCETGSDIALKVAIELMDDPRAYPELSKIFSDRLR